MGKLTVVGLGAMGSGMAINYDAAGHDVTVWNSSYLVEATAAIFRRGANGS